MNKYFHRLDQE